MMKIYLDFKNDTTGLIQISEPVGFDGADFTVEQEQGRYGRDVIFGNEEVSLKFYDGVFENGLTMGLAQLLDYYKIYGFESEVEFILEKDNVTFTVGVLDFQTAKTDLVTYIECKVIQSTVKAKIKRRYDVDVDVFSTTDLDGGTITTPTIHKVLLKAKPVIQNSEFKSSGTRSFVLNEIDPTKEIWGFNLAQSVTKYGINDTLGWLDDVFNTDDFLNFESFGLLRAKTTLNNIKVTATINMTYDVRQDSGLTGSGFMGLYLCWGTTFDPSNTSTTRQLMYLDVWANGTTKIVNLNNTYDFTIPLVAVGGKVWLFWAGYGQADCNIYVNHTNFEVKVSATSKALDNVVSGIRYIDLIEQNLKSVGGFDTVAPRFQTGGQFYEQMAFNGNLLRQKTDKPFYVNTKDLMEGLQEVNADYQIDGNNEIFVGQYDELYTNIDCGAFLQLPDSDFTTEFNPRYTINQFGFSYKNYEQDRQEENTTDSIHTESKYLLPNLQVENKKQVEVNHVRDPYLIESSRRIGISQDSTSLDSDNKLFVIDALPFASGQTSPSMYAFVTIQSINDGSNYFVFILNDGSFNWTLLGIENNFLSFDNNFLIIEPAIINANYKVLEVTSNIIKLVAKSPATPTFNGETTMQFRFNYDDAIDYICRTSQDLSGALNLLNSNDFMNLKYSIRRNIVHWEKYLKTAIKYKNEVIKNTFFKNNGLCQTNFDNETVIYTENENLDLSNVDAILSPVIMNSRVVADFETVKTALDNLRDNKGFFRFIDTQNRVLKVHPVKLTYEWLTEVLTIKAEIRNESDFLTIDTIGIGMIEINEVGYDRIILNNNWFKIVGFFLYLYDLNNIPLINPYRFEKVKVNGITFTNTTDLSNALNGL